MSRKIPENKEDAKKYIISINPATLEEIEKVPLMSKEEISSAIKRAEEAFPYWSSIEIVERGRYLLKARDYIIEHMDEIASLISKENGKPRVEALNAEIFTVCDLITHYVHRSPDILRPKNIPMHIFKMLKESKIVYQPLGVVTVVSPWNYPFGIPLSGIVFALLCGNTVIFKPSSEVLLIGKKIEEIICKGGGVPDGVFNIVIGTGGDVGTKIFEPPVKKIIFTGSTQIGRWIAEIASKNFIPCVLELGGKDPMIVFDDADIELASSGAVWGAFTNCGQVCASVERAYVHKRKYDEFVEKVTQKTKKLRVGPAYADHNFDVGPMISLEQLSIVEDQVLDALKKGARVLTGGKRPDGLKGYFYEPTILVDVDHTMKVMKEETFGPLLPIMSFTDAEEAIQLANDTTYGLTASVWSADQRKAEYVARRIDAGTLVINDHGFTYGLCETPWQGVKESGIGRSHSDAGLLEFVYPKHINIDHSPSIAKRRAWWFSYSEDVYCVLKDFVKAVSYKKYLPSFLLKAIFKGSYRKTFM